MTPQDTTTADMGADALRSAAQAALDALEQLDGLDTETEVVTIHVCDEIEALRAALASAAQPPAADLAGDGASTKAAAQQRISEFSQLQDALETADALRADLAECRQSLKRAVSTLHAHELAEIGAPNYVDADRAMRTPEAPQPAVQQGEPVVWRSWDSENSRWNFTLWPDEWTGHADAWEPLYTHPAAPATQGDALDQGVREELSIGKAINRAARDLPEGWEIRIDLERGAGVVHLTDPEGNETMSEGGELFSDQINAAIDAARAAQGGTKA